jgi:hypothetical protein
MRTPQSTSILVMIAAVLTFSTGCPPAKDTLPNASNMKPPANVQADIDKRDKDYAEMMRKQQENPTPSGSQGDQPQQ